MNNFNTNLYETKREIINYSNKITEGLKKPTAKNLEKINDEQLEIIRNNYNRAVLNEIDEEPLVLLDDSEIIKKYGKNLRTYARYEMQVL